MQRNHFAFPPPPPPPAPAPAPVQSDIRPHNSRGGRRGNQGNPRRSFNQGHNHPRGIIKLSTNRSPQFQPRYLNDPSINDDFPTHGAAGATSAETSANVRSKQLFIPPGIFSHAGTSQQKRQYGEAFGQKSQQHSQSQVVPPTPSFGHVLPIFRPSTPSSPKQSNIGPPKALASKAHLNAYNHLGLTPVKETLSSGEEDNMDEEAQLAAATNCKKVERLVLTYKDRTYHIKTPEDVARWISDRRSCYPTQARRSHAAVRGLELAAAKEGLQRARNQAREKQKASAGMGRSNEAKAKELPKTQHDTSDKMAKAKRKIEKLKKQLEKEERKFSNAEASATNREHMEERDDDRVSTRNQVELAPAASSESSVKIVKVNPPQHSQQKAEGAPDTLQRGLNVEISKEDNPMPPTGSTTSETASNVSRTIDTDDPTSSSESSSSDDASASEGPEQKPSKKEPGPRFANLTHERNRKICHAFRGGRCKFGARCRFRHGEIRIDPSASASTKKEPASDYRSHRRISLYQRLVQQEEEKEAAEARRESERATERD